MRNDKVIAFLNADFWKGFAGWFIVTTVAYFLFNIVFSLFFMRRIGAGATIVAAAWGIIVMLLFNIIGAVWLHLRNPSMRNGFITAFVINYLILIAIVNLTDTTVPAIPFFPFLIYLINL